MELKKENLSVWLAGASVLALLINYNLVTIKGFSLSFWGLDLENIEFSKILPALIAISLILSLLIYHLINMVEVLAPTYRSGYAESKSFQELVKARVSAASGTDRYGCPCGGLNHGLLPGTFELGQWVKPDGTLSECVFITIDQKTHISGVLHGLRRCCTIRASLQWLGPIVLALWALASVAA